MIEIKEFVKLKNLLLKYGDFDDKEERFIMGFFLFDYI